MHSRELQKLVIRDSADAVIGAQVVDDLFNVGVSGLILLGVDHADAVPQKVRSRAVGDAIGVEDQHQLGLGVGGVAGQNVQKGLAGLFQAEA